MSSTEVLASLLFILGILLLLKALGQMETREMTSDKFQTLSEQDQRDHIERWR